MATSPAASLIDWLQRHRLLKPVQLAELASLDGKSPQELAKELVRRGWLTAYQGRQILAGKTDRLVFGPYVLLEQLGAGGSGHVFKARHIHMERIVALKVLRGDLLQDADAVGRFHREVEVLSQLSHPAIVHAFDAGVAGNTHFLAMEFIDGIDLERQVKEAGPLPVPQACEYIRQAAAGLQYAHERSLVHRDIKPSNLLVSTTSSQAITTPPLTYSSAATHQIKILDLGLAKLREPVEGSKTKNLTVLAGNSVMMGTPDYMAPEQAVDFRTADIRADIYGLGCTLYFLLAGRPPFSGSLTAKLALHQQGEFPPLPVLERYPAVADVLKRMLAKWPGDRFQTPGEVAEALSRAVSAGHTFRKSEPDKIPVLDRLRQLPGRHGRKVLIAGEIFLLLGLGWLGLSFLTGGGPPPIPPSPRQVLQFDGGGTLVVLPDDLFRASPVLAIEVWFKASGDGVILGYQGNAFPAGPNGYVPALSVGTDHLLRGQFWDGESNPVASPVKVVDGRWHHAALVSDGKSHTLYLDGEPVASRASQALNHLTMSKNQIGAGFTGGWPGGNKGWHHFAGQLAELRVWHVARTPQEIRRDMSMLWFGSGKGLAAWYPMLEATGDELTDYSGQRRHGKLGGGDPKRMPIWVTLK